MNISLEDAILIKQSLSAKVAWCTKACWVNCPTSAGNLEASTVCWRESTRRVQLSGNQATVRPRVRRMVDDLVLSQRTSQQSSDQLEISHETAILRSSVHRIMHRDLQLTCFKRRRTQLLSEANCVTHLTCWQTTLSSSVEEIHSVGTINNVETSYFIQLKICYLVTTFRCPSDILITSWLFTARWSTWPGNHLVPCVVAELVGSCIPIHAFSVV